MLKKAETKKQKVKAVPQEKTGNSFFDYLRFGESYTSLILGIIVVIIATALLLSFVHNKNAGNVNTPISEQTQNTVQITQQQQDLAKRAPSNTVETTAPTATVAPTETPIPTVKPTQAPKLTLKPSPKPTIKVIKKVVAKAAPTAVVKKIAQAKVKPTNIPQVKTDKDNNVWVVQKGESLWIIAEKKYTSGYNWVDIAKANKLADPSDIHVGDRLVLPRVTPEPSTIVVEKPTVVTNDQQFSSTKRTNEITNEISGKSYTVVKGDTLWNIAVRAYGDGYKWTAIAKANNLANPGLIFSGNKLIIPRG